MEDPVFRIARNPQPDSKLPYLLRLPVDGGLVLKARDTWPRSARIYCHPFEEDWLEGTDIVEETPALTCRRRGAVIDLVLDRPRLARSQFVFTEVRGRPAIFWQTRNAARKANPGARVPRARALASGYTITVDTRERYGYRFAGRDVETERAALSAGDYAVLADGDPIASVERKTLENFASSLSDGTLAFQMQRLAEIPRRRLSSRDATRRSSSSSTCPERGSPTCSRGYRSATPRCRSCSLIAGSSQRSSPIGSSPPRWPRRLPVEARLRAVDTGNRGI